MNSESDLTGVAVRVKFESLTTGGVVVGDVVVGIVVAGGVVVVGCVVVGGELVGGVDVGGAVLPTPLVDLDPKFRVALMCSRSVQSRMQPSMLPNLMSTIDKSLAFLHTFTCWKQ